MAIIAGEIGGNTKLALFSHKFDADQNKMMIGKLIAEIVPFPTKKYETESENGNKLNIKAMLEDFLNEVYYGREDNFGEGIEKSILGACFGIAAPLDGDEANKKATISRPALDLNVTFSESDFRQELPCPNIPVCFLNDMVAIGKNLFVDQENNQLEILYQSQKPSNPKDDKAIMLVSGGLGQALWYWDASKEAFISKSSEGGHGLFAPRTEDEEKLWLHLLDERKQVISYEYVLSAPGLIKIYEFLKTTGRYGEESGELRQLLDQNKIDPTPIIDKIIDKAINNSDPLSMATLNMFISIMGARAGDLALIYEAKGGIYIGGIPIPIEKLKDGIFTEAFLDKENKFKQYNQDISVYVYQEKDSALWGAARHAVDAGFVTKGKFAYKRMNR